MVGFVNQVSQNASKQSNNRFDSLKRVPDVIKYSSIPMKKEELQKELGSKINR